jgi:hypothetical protein
VRYEVKTQAALDKALAKAKPGDLVVCVGSGWFDVSGSASVTAYGSASVRAYDSASVTASGSASVTASGSASVTAYDSASVTAYGSASVTASGSASVTASGSASVTAYGSASVTAYGSASVTAYGSASVTAYDSASVTASDSASVRAYGSASVTASKFVAVHDHGPKVKVAGGVLIQPPALDSTEIWVDFHGVERKRGRLIVYKALNADLNSGHGFAYVPGTTVKAPDWADTDSCGAGLHFGPTPHHATAYNLEAVRFVACSVKQSEARVITDGYGGSDKIKAPACKVLYECDIHGNKLNAEVAA